jgi:cation diffusion facilitator family transporter
MLHSPKKAVIIASFTAFSLAIIKLIGGLMTGSLTVLSSSIDSLLDFFVSIINFFAIQKSMQGDDEKYHYGYGKIEGLAALMEGLFIIVSGLLISFFAIRKFINRDFSIDANTSLIFMVISIVFTIGIVWYLNRVAKSTNNLVIKSDALHYKTDLFTNIGIIITIIIIKFTGWYIIDVIVSLAISVYIIYGASQIIQSAYEMLMDKALQTSDIKKITDIIEETSPDFHSYHFLKTRCSGKHTFIEFHLVFDTKITILDAHTVSDAIECKLKSIFSHCIVTIHLDPYDDSHMEVCQIH